MCLFVLGYLLLLVVREKCEITKTLFRCHSGSLISSLESASDALSHVFYVILHCSVKHKLILFCKELRRCESTGTGEEPGKYCIKGSLLQKWDISASESVSPVSDGGRRSHVGPPLGQKCVLLVTAGMRFLWREASTAELCLPYCW